MTDPIAHALDRLKQLATPQELRSAAEAGQAPSPAPPVNGHVHLPPNFSAFDSVQQALDLASQQGLGVLGASNYYDFAVYGPFANGALERGIFPLFGLEIIAMDDELRDAGVKVNDPGNPGKTYICGKGITRFADMTDRAGQLLQTIRDNEADRMAKMTRTMANLFAQAGVETGLDAEAIRRRIVARHDSPLETVWLQERHIAQAFQERLFELVEEPARADVLARVFGQPPASTVTDAVAVQGEIRSQLMKSGKPAFVGESFVSFDQAVQLILELGGIPCYPTLADGAEPICPFEQPVGKLIETLKARNIQLAELIPLRNSPDVLVEYATGLRAAGIAVTAGTEHNTLDLVPLAPTCAGGMPIPQPVQDIFWEGACVLAAHQLLSLHGQAGYVTDDGTPNPAYDDADRIGELARIGAAAIAKTLHTDQP